MRQWIHWTPVETSAVQTLSFYFFLTNLDQTKNINIFHRIPEKEKMIQQLKEQLTDIDFDMNRMKDIMGFIWGERD